MMMGIGDEVVCIKENISSMMPSELGDIPEFGTIYTIRDIMAHPLFPKLVGIKLMGMHCYVQNYGTLKIEAWYPARWFKPVKRVKQDTNIDIFKKIDKDTFDGALGDPDTPIKEPEKEDA
jgi:hypothetical protein